MTSRSEQIEAAACDVAASYERHGARGALGGKIELLMDALALPPNSPDLRRVAEAAIADMERDLLRFSDDSLRRKVVIEAAIRARARHGGGEAEEEIRCPRCNWRGLIRPYVPGEPCPHCEHKPDPVREAERRFLEAAEKAWRDHRRLDLPTVHNAADALLAAREQQGGE